MHRKEKSILLIWRNSWRATLKFLKLNYDYVVSSREREKSKNEKKNTHVLRLEIISIWNKIKSGVRRQISNYAYYLHHIKLLYHFDFLVV